MEGTIEDFADRFGRMMSAGSIRVKDSHIIEQMAVPGNLHAKIDVARSRGEDTSIMEEELIRDQLAALESFGVRMPGAEDTLRRIFRAYLALNQETQEEGR